MFGRCLQDLQNSSSYITGTTSNCNVDHIVGWFAVERVEQIGHSEKVGW